MSTYSKSVAETMDGILDSAERLLQLALDLSGNGQYRDVLSVIESVHLKYTLLTNLEVEIIQSSDGE